MNVIGKTRVFKNEFNGNVLYSTTISNKNMDGEYENMYINIQFPKLTAIENNTEIDIKNGFLSFYKDRNGLTHIKLVVMEFEMVDVENDNYSNDYICSDLPF